MHVFQQSLVDDFARAACETLIGQIGFEAAYREAAMMLAVADDELRAMYLEIIAVMDSLLGVNGR